MITVNFELGADGKYHTYTHYGDDIATKSTVKFMEHIGEACDALNKTLVPLNGALMQANQCVNDKDDLTSWKV